MYISRYVDHRQKCTHFALFLAVNLMHVQTGEICLDILKKEWSPIWSLQSACRAIIALLSDPEGDSPLNCDAGEECGVSMRLVLHWACRLQLTLQYNAGNMIRAGDMRAYNSMVRLYCAEFALDDFPAVEV